MQGWRPSQVVAELEVDVRAGEDVIARAAGVPCVARFRMEAEQPVEPLLGEAVVAAVLAGVRPPDSPQPKIDLVVRSHRAAAGAAGAPPRSAPSLRAAPSRRRPTAWRGRRVYASYQPPCPDYCGGNIAGDGFVRASDGFVRACGRRLPPQRKKKAPFGLFDPWTCEWQFKHSRWLASSAVDIDSGCARAPNPRRRTLRRCRFDESELWQLEHMKPMFSFIRRASVEPCGVWQLVQSSRTGWCSHSIGPRLSAWQL